MARKKIEDEYVTETMEVTYRKGSHLSNSRKKEGEFSPLTRNEEGELGQVTLKPIDKNDEPTVIHTETVYVYEQDSSAYQSEEQSLKAELAEIVVRLLLEAAWEAGKPVAKQVWDERFEPALEAWLLRRQERRSLRKQRRADKKSRAVEAKVVEPVEDIGTVAEAFRTNMSSTEAQARYLMAMAAQRFADEQMRLIGDTEIQEDTGYEELEQALAALPSDQVVQMLERFEAKPSLLAGDSLTGLGLVLGVERANDAMPVKGSQ